jgi:hypothetical protein
MEGEIGPGAGTVEEEFDHGVSFIWFQFRHSGMRRRDKIAKLFCAEGTDPEIHSSQH